MNQTTPVRAPMAAGRVFGRPGLRYVVFAQAKSGTTWLQRLLSAHPGVHCAESRLLGDFFLGDNPTGPAITVEKFVTGMLRHFHAPRPCAAMAGARFEQVLLFNMIDAIAYSAMAYSGKAVYGEKLTPYPRTARACVQTLHEYDPGLCFVHLVRDVRDVIVSGYSHWANIRIGVAKAAGKVAEAAKLQEELEARRVPDKIVEDTTTNWVENVAAGIEGEKLFAGSLRLRYEDLVADPGDRFVTLFSRIGADPAAEVVRAAVAAASFEKLSGGRESGEEDRTSFFRKGVAGDWEGWLTPEQTERVERRAAGMMDALGYGRAGAGSAAGAGAIDYPRVHTTPRKSEFARTSPNGD